MTAQAERRERTRTAILDAAEQAYARTGGYRATTVGAIAEHADVAVATLYDHFAGKLGVYLAVAERLVRRNEEYVAEARRSAPPGLERAVAIGESYVRFHLDHPHAFRLVGLADIDGPVPEPVRLARRAIDRRLAAMLRSLAAELEVAAADGTIAPVPARRASTVMWASLNGVLALHARGALPRAELEPSLTLARELAVSGLRAGR